MKKKHRMIRNLLTDAAAAGLALTIFALFHHVLPRKQDSLNLQTVIPAAAVQQQVKTAAETEQAAAETEETQAEPEKTAAEAEQIPAEAEKTAKTENAARQPARKQASTGRSDTGSRSASGRQSKQSKRNTGSGKDGMNSKGGSALTDSGTATADSMESTEDIPLAEKFSGIFTDMVTVTENSYTSPDLAITVSEEQEGSITYYVADIHVRDITCFRTALAADTYGSGFRDSIEDMAALNNALLAVNGDYYGNTGEGVVIRNGVIYRANPTDCDVCVLYYDGTMKVMPGSSFSVEEAVAEGAWQAWTFGPALLDAEGNTVDTFSSSSRIISANPRTAIGYYEPGHYCLIVVDGRGESSGTTLPQLSRLFHDMGCTAAYNLDGGNSSVMVWGDEVINNPSGGGRESSDALLIAEVRDYE